MANDFKVDTSTLQMINTFYDLHKDWFKKNIETAIFVGIRKGAEENYIIEDLGETGVVCLRLEVWHKNCEECKDDIMYSPIIRMDMREMPNRFVDKSIDLIFAKQVLEHVSKEEAEILLRSWTKIARKMVIVETPKGEYKQGPIDGNPYEVHKCALYEQDFENAGYMCYTGGYDHEDLRHLLGVWIP